MYDDTGFDSGYVYVFIIQDKGTWEEVQKLTPTDMEAGDWFVKSAAIVCDIAVIVANGDDDRGDRSNYGYVYIKIGGKWIKNGKIVPEDGASGDEFGSSVALSGNTNLFGAPDTGE